MDLNAALASWLQSMLTSFSMGIYAGVIPLAGGPLGELWRWVLVEQGLFVLFLLVGVWLTRMILGLGRTQNWGAGAVFAVVLGLFWNWYGVTASYAIEQNLHPRYGWEWTFFTWGLPLMLSGIVFPHAGFLVQLGVGMAEAALVVLALAKVWIAAPNPVPRLAKAWREFRAHRGGKGETPRAEKAPALRPVRRDNHPWT